jgi:hypothetical protein
MSLKYATFIGVDFSGGRNAGRKIWVSKGVPDGGALSIVSCDRMSELCDSDERSAAMECLRGIIVASDSVVGLDFPFGIPRELMGYSRWESFVRQFSRNYPDESEFRSRCLADAGRKELKRLTDVETKTPFCPYNLRLYRQTYFGIRDVLAPLVEEGSACVAPMQWIVAGKPLVVEICPASTLKVLGLYRQYKGNAREQRKERAAIVGGLGSRGLVSIDAKVRPKLLDDAEGDALDSVVAALAAFRALEQIGRDVGLSKAHYTTEGFVYA